MKFTSPSNRGVPDRVFIKNGNVVWVEFKRQGGELRRQQSLVVNRMINHGAKVFCVDNVEEFKHILS